MSHRLYTNLSVVIAAFVLVILSSLSMNAVTAANKAIMPVNNINSSGSTHSLQANNTTQSSMIITKLLANNLQNRLQKAGALLEITSKLPQVNNTSFAHLLNQTLTTLHGIPKDTDIQKRQIAQNMLLKHITHT